MTVSHGVWADPIRHAGNQPYENFALWRWQLAGERDNRIHRSVGEFCEVMRLPIVSRARREQRVKGLLPRDVRLRTEMLAVRLTESAHWSDEFLRFRRGAGVEDRQQNDFLAVNVFGKKGQRRCFAQHDPDIEFLRRRFYELTIFIEDLFGLAERKDDQAGKYFRTHGKELEFKLSDDAKIPASATKRPEQIRV